MSHLSIGCVKNLPKPLVEVELLHWIVAYPVDKVIYSLNNWRLNVPSTHLYIWNWLFKK